MPLRINPSFARVRTLVLISLLASLGAARGARSEERPAGSRNPATWPELAAASDSDFAISAFRESPLSGLSEAEMARWLESLPGKTSRLRSERTNDLLVAGFEGLARLRAPWPPDAVLQIAPFDHDGLGIHFWSGLTGVSLYYYEHPRPMWAGYRTTRRANELVPATHVLLGTDNDRYHRSMRGIIEVRHQKGTLVVSRGDLRLVTIPMAETPSEVIFERRALFQSFTMYRGPSIPEEPATDGRDLLDEKPPAKLRWAGDISMGAGLVRDQAGPVHLERPADAGTVWSGVRLPATGLYEARVQLGAAAAGTGIYLADDSGRPKVVIGLQRHSPTSAAVLAFLRPDSPQLECGGEARSQRIAFTGEGQWLRIAVGPTTIKCQVSGDGRHWGRALEPARGIAGPFSQIGLIAFRNAAEGRISINRLEIRELSDVTSVSDSSLLEKIPEEVLERPSRWGAWCELVLNTQPPGVTLRDWRMACAVAQLSRGSPGALGNTILEGLLDDCLDSGISAARFLQVLGQAALACDGWNAAECHRFTQYYERLGLREAHRGHPAPWSLVSRPLLANPLTTSAQYQTMPESLVRIEFAHLLTAGRWRETKDLCRTLNFWNRSARPGQNWPDHRQRLHDLTEWTQSVAALELGELTADPSQEQAAFCPVSVPPDRGGLNLMTDLDAALKASQYDDACRLLLGTREDFSSELLPAVGDPTRLIRLPLAISAGMIEHPEWREVMRNRYEKLARARIQIASEASQVEDLRLLAAQFAGLPAAATARMWLGDRALIEGNFLGALDEFEEALPTAPTEQRDALNARIDLARACLGIGTSDRESGRKAIVPANPLPGLEKALSDLRSRSRKNSSTSASEELQTRTFESSAWDAEPAGEIQLDPGKAPGAAELARLDWSGRQIAHVQTGDLLYVANRRQVVCFNLKTNRQLWRVAFPDPDPTVAAWPMQAFQPVASANRLFVRSSEKDWLGLSCLDAVSGKLRWRTERGMTVLSDPLLLQGNLYFFSVSSPPLDRIWRMDLNTVDPESGAIISRNQVLEMQRTEGRAYSCQAALAGNRLIATIAGAVFCCDLSGRPVWLRREPWPAAIADPDAPLTTFANPVVIGEKTLVLQAGALDLLCLENRTGKVIWRRPLAEARQLIGVDDHRAYVQTGDGLTAISLSDGAIAWWKSRVELLDARWVRAGQPLLVIQREEVANQVSWPLLTWVDSESGRDLALWPLAALKARNPQLSHLIPQQDGFLAFAGEGDPPSRRILWKLTRHAGPALPAHHDDDGVDRWTNAASDPRSRQMAERFLPEWSFAGGAPDPGNGFRDEYSGQKEVLATLATSDRPIRFTREMHRQGEPAAGARKTKLIVQAGHDPSKRWQLRVRAGGRELLSTIVEAASSKNNWGTWEIDLSEFEETGARVSVDQIPLDQSARGYWKRLELVR